MKTDTAIARTVGVLFVVATAAAVASDMLVRPIRDDDDYLTTFATHETRVIIESNFEPPGALLLGAVLILVAGMRRVHGHSPTSTVSVALTLPIGVQEMVPAGWLIIRSLTSPGSGVEPGQGAERRPVASAGRG